MVIVSHPVHQQAYETVVAAQEANLLHSFRNGLYMTGRGLSSPRLLGVLPRGLRARVERIQRRRWHSDIDVRRVSTISRYHLLALSSRPLLRLAGYSGWDREWFPWDIDQWANERFDSAVGRSLARTSHGAHLVHAWEGSALSTLRAARKLGMATVLDAASAFEYFVQAISEEGGKPPSARLIRRFKLERELADYIFVPSEFVKSCLIENGVPSGKIVQIPYGVDPTSFVPEEKIIERPIRILFAGRIGLRKGVAYLLSAWSTLDLKDAELVLVGGVDRYGAALLRKYYGQYHHVDQVPLFDLHRWFQSSDIFVFPSLAEGSALVTYMALASGLPTVTTVNSGSVVRDGISGFLVPPRDVGALANVIRVLCGDSELRRRMGAAGRNSVLASYTWQHYRMRIGSAYKAILDGGDPRRSLDPPLPA